MSIIFNGKEYATKDSARTAAWKFANREAWYRSRDKANEKWPGKRSARAAVSNKIKDGRLAPAKFLPCFDCGKQAKYYDHWRGYRRENRYVVQAVCSPCNQKRIKKGRS